MVNNSSLNGPSRNPSVQPTGPAAGAKRSANEAALAKGGPAFQALLDKLQVKSRALSEDSAEVNKPEELSNAVDRAKSTLTDALSLSDQLLEAYRQAARDKPAGEKS